MIPVMVAALFAARTLPPLHVDGPDIKDPAGNVVKLRGCNLGNWFMIEHWMWDESQPEDSSHDQYQLEQILGRRFGEPEKDRMIDLYRSSWITDRDLKIIKSFRFNCVRLPLNYRMFEDDAKPFHLKSDAWKWTDRAVKMCADNGLYVILDMHGVQGGQSKEDHTGRAGQNLLWTTPEDQSRLAWLWSKVAAHYRSVPTVAAYDVINEPYGGQKKQIRSVFDQVYAAIRPVDPEKLIYAMGHYSGFDMYGDPHANGWHNVGIEMHYYPGLFGNGSPTVGTQLRHLSWVKNVLAPQVAKLKVPFYVGELNVVFNSAGNPEMMRRTYDLYESFGWSTTMWSYKALSRGGGFGDANWGMVTNRQPIPKIDFARSSQGDIQNFFSSHATMPYDIFEGLRKVMAPVSVELPPLTEPPVRTVAPQESLEGWIGSDIGDPMKGGLQLTGKGFDLYGGGEDIWGERDQFRYLHRETTGDFDLSVKVDSLEDLGPYCKAGLMVRGGLTADAPFLLLSVFPSGEVQTAIRASQGGSAEGSTAIQIGFPVEMRVQRTGGIFKCSARKVGEANWHSLPISSPPKLEDDVQIGAVALSHDAGQIVKASYEDLKLSR